MTTINFYFASLIALAILITSCDKIDPLPDIPAPAIGIAGDGNLSANLDYIVEKYQLPAIAAMTITGGEVLEAGQSGERVFGEGNVIGPNDKWHLGSITKSMTATLTAILIEEGQLDWETSIQEVIQGDYLSDYKDVTVFELLSQSSGVPAQDLLYDPADPRPIREIRLEWALEALNMPQGDKGTFVYSNNNFVIAGAMLEIIMDQPWEALMEQYLFDPLEMDDSGFGAPRDSENGYQPWGHKRNGSTWESYDPESPYADNPAALGPAGTVHCTLNDLLKYCRLHLGYEDILSEESLSVLHNDVNNSGYALGWNVSGHGIFHSGSNARWFAQIFISPEADFVNFAVTNSADESGQRSTAAVINTLEIMGGRFQQSL